MNIQTEKLELMQLLLATEDVTILQSIRDIFGTSRQDDMLEIVGQTSDGEPITKKDLIDRAIESNKAIAEGRVTSIENLEKEMENWSS